MNAKMLAAVAVGTAGTMATAQVPFVLYTITAVNDQGTSSLSVTQNAANIREVDGGFTWDLNDTFADGFVFENGAQLNTGTFGLTGPLLGNASDELETQFATASINFSATASDSDTTFIVTTGIVDVGLIDTLFEASAGFSLTDSEPLSGLATVAGFGDAAPDLFAFSFNGSPTGSLLTGPFSTTLTTSGNDSVSSTTPGGFIDTLQATFSVTVSANDLFAGNAFVSVAGVVPTPASAAMLGLGGLVASRRRR